MFDLPLRMVRGERTFCDANWSWRNAPHQDTCLTLWFITAGDGTLRTSQAEYELHPGDCFLLRLWDSNIAHHNPAKPLVVSWACFDCLDGKEHVLPSSKCPNPREHRRIPDISFFDQLLQRAIHHFSEGPAHVAEATQWLKTALLEIAQLDRRSQFAGLALEQHLLVAALCANIREHPEKITDMPTLAVQAKGSVDHLIRICKRHKGVTPWEFVIRCRIEKAGNLLRFSSHSVSQIADLLGYADIYSFSKQFKAHTGQAPTQYRNQT